VSMCDFISLKKKLAVYVWRCNEKVTHGKVFTSSRVFFFFPFQKSWRADDLDGASRSQGKMCLFFPIYFFIGVFC
jgi:hypothetical protein